MQKFTEYTVVVIIISTLLLSSSSSAFDVPQSKISQQKKGSGQVSLIGDPDVALYPFKPGDGVAVSTFPDSSSFLNDVFPIDDRGYVEFPIVGKVNVSRMTVKEFAGFLKETFKSYLRYPNIYVKPVVRVSLLGGFQRPGLYYVDKNATLWEVVRTAGGPILEDGIYEMHWERNGDDNPGDVVSFFEQGVSLQKMGFKSGDQIWTPAADARDFWFYVQSILPIITFSLSLWILYLNYQQGVITSQGVNF